MPIAYYSLESFLHFESGVPPSHTCTKTSSSSKIGGSAQLYVQSFFRYKAGKVSNKSNRRGMEWMDGCRYHQPIEERKGQKRPNKKKDLRS